MKKKSIKSGVPVEATQSPPISSRRKRDPAAKKHFYDCLAGKAVKEKTMSEETKFAAVVVCGAVATIGASTVLPIWRYGSPITWSDPSFEIWCGAIALLAGCVAGLLVYGFIERKR